jgi:hypothetical protein
MLRHDDTTNWQKDVTGMIRSVIGASADHMKESLIDNSGMISAAKPQKPEPSKLLAGDR